jgi:hypothetical protein
MFAPNGLREAEAQSCTPRVADCEHGRPSDICEIDLCAPCRGCDYIKRECHCHCTVCDEFKRDCVCPK